MTMPSVRDTATPKTTPRCMARALYDNMADTPDELAFRKGDMLTVLEQNTAGTEGWWLCALRGRQGICPGNRLRLLAGVYDTGGCPPSPPPTPAPAPAPAPAQHARPLPLPPHSASQHSLYKGHSRRRSLNTQPNKVMLPHRVGDLYIYEQPQNLCPSPSPSQTHISLHQSHLTSPRTQTPPHLSLHSPHPNINSIHNNTQLHLPLHMQGGMETYDVPRSIPVSATYDAPRSLLPRFQGQGHGAVPPGSVPVIPGPGDWYDVPRAPASLTLFHQQQLTPSSSASSLTMDSMSSSNRSSLANMPDYDIPKSRGSNYTSNTLRNQSPCPSQTYDVPLPNPLPKELPLEWAEALDMLERLQMEATDSISRLLGFVRPGWRSHAAMSNQLLDVRLGSTRLRAALHDLAQFTEGTLGNAANAHDKGLTIKLRPLVKALRDADRLVNNVIENLDALNWSIELLCRPDDENHDTSSPDALDQLIACARALTEDVRQTASFIQGNSTLLFKKSKTNGVGEWVEEYDYVKLESRESVDKKHAEIKDSLPNELKKSFDTVIKDADYSTTNVPLNDNNMAPNDKQLILYYAKQTMTYFEYLTTAIDAFLQSVERNQPPAAFLAHGKFVVLHAHRLVYIGDTVHKNIENTEFKSKVLACSDGLSNGLAMTVSKAKNAALNFPSVSAVQEMVDSVVDVCNSARDLRNCMIQATSQP